MRILLTGGTGLLGIELLKLDADLIATTERPRQVQHRLLDVGREVEQVHDLSDASPADAG